MTRQPSRTRRVERHHALSYLTKAKEFYEGMQKVIQDRLWNAASLNAVHCAISACDAVLVSFTQQRSASSDHDEAVYLLKTAAIPEAKAKAETLRKILRYKHEVEYEYQQVTASEARELAKLTERFYRWAHGLVTEK